MNIITFDCRNCGAPLNVPQNAAAAICPYCHSQHKVAFKDGVLTADLVKKVAEHEVRITTLEDTDTLTQEALEAVSELSRVQLEFEEFKKAHSSMVLYPKRKVPPPIWGYYVLVSIPALMLLGAGIAGEERMAGAMFLATAGLGILFFICAAYQRGIYLESKDRYEKIEELKATVARRGSRERKGKSASIPVAREVS